MAALDRQQCIDLVCSRLPLPRRFYRWHIDSALYDLSTPKVTTLYALSVPQGAPQTLRYDDGTGDELPVPLGTTAFVSGISMFEDLPEYLQSLAVRAKVRYAPHPYIWMSSAASNSLGLGLVSEGKELSLDELPAWEESKIKTLPMCWKNPSTGKLHLQIHPSAVHQILIDPLPAGATMDANTLYPQGAHLTDIKEVRDLVYSIQRPAIAPEKVYAHDWKEGDMCLFHNAGTLHSVVGAFKETDVRIFHQCNLAASEDPKGPTEEDLKKYA
jgi:alpha-ketoglutarate-dependent taurine dioxygenase